MIKEMEFDGYYNKYLKVELLEDKIELSINSENWSPISIKLDSKEAKELATFILDNI